MERTRLDGRTFPHGNRSCCTIRNGVCPAGYSAIYVRDQCTWTGLPPPKMATFEET